MDPAQRLLYARYGVTPVNLVALAAAEGAPSASSDAKAAAPKAAPKAAAAAAPKPAEPARNAPAPAAAAADAKASDKKSDKKAGDGKDKKSDKKPEPKAKAAAEPKAKLDKSKDPTALRMAEEGRKRAEAMKNMTPDEKKAYRKAEDAKKAADAAAAAAAPKPAAAPKAGAAPAAAAAAAAAGAGAGAKPAAAAGAGGDAKDVKSGGGDDPNVTVKVPKGARDILPEQMVIREKAFNMIRGVFQRHGAVEIDTPVFELKETLTNKYGEDSKLIYDLADQGGELLALRYDLTVPFARYLATHKPGNIKRFHIGRVYRRDNPIMSRGRFREFYQCDFDVAGYESAPPMLVDAECLKVLTEILDQLNLANGYVVKLNHRKLLDAIMAVAGVPADRFRTVCSAIDKLDKEPWATVRQEIIDKLDGKGALQQRQSTADIIGEYVKHKDKPFALLQVLEKDARLSQNKAAVEAFTDLKEMCNYMQAFGMLDKISLDMSLARGLDYYTGVIYEATLKAKGGVDVGSIAAGGRYDGLVGMFSGAAVPAVGVSVGIERIFNLLQEQAEKAAAGKPLRTNHTQVLVCTMGSDMVLHRLALATELWAAGIAAEFSYLKKPSFQAQTDEAKKADIPVAVFIGKDELAGNFVKVKDLRLPPVPGFQGDSVARKDLVAHIRKILAL